MTSSILRCNQCGTLPSVDMINAPGLSVCPDCGNFMAVHLFPAILKKQSEASAGEHLVVDSESSCFYHPSKRAEIPCDGCGRFLCGLCDVEMDGQHLCPKCIEQGASAGSLKPLRHEYIYYDQIALSLAVYPLIVFYFTFITAPIALYYVVRHWNKPLSYLPRSRWRFVTAFLIAGLQLLAWGALVASIVS